jgi:hypothetical protein
MNRRKFCLSSLATAMSGAAAGAGCLPGGERAARPAAASTASVQLYKFVYDGRYPAARAFGVAAAGQAPSAGAIVAIEGDITALWSRDLRARWCEGDGAIAGMTTARTLFCLEQLARDHWMRVAIRVEHALGKGHDSTHRVTASEPAIARMRWALTAGDWARQLPAALAACRNGDGAHVTRMIGPSCPSATTGETLVSFVIA